MSAQDQEQTRRASDPGEGSFAITPSDSTTFDPPILSLYCTGAGDVCFVGRDGKTDTVTLPDKFIYPVSMKQVKATGTTATGLHGIR